MITFKQIRPAPLKVDRIRLELLNGMRTVNKGIAKDFNATTADWNGDKPTFETTISLKQSTITASTNAKGSGLALNKWKWLDMGTAVRYATMTANFIPKTTPGQLSTRGGAGGLRFVDKRRPRPGVKARNWTIIIMEKWAPLFAEQMDKSIAEGAKKSGNSI